MIEIANFLRELFQTGFSINIQIKMNEPVKPILESMQSVEPVEPIREEQVNDYTENSSTESIPEEKKELVSSEIEQPVECKPKRQKNVISGAYTQVENLKYMFINEDIRVSMRGRNPATITVNKLLELLELDRRELITYVHANYSINQRTCIYRLIELYKDGKITIQNHNEESKLNSSDNILETEAQKEAKPIDTTTTFEVKNLSGVNYNSFLLIPGSNSSYYRRKGQQFELKANDNKSIWLGSTDLRKFSVMSEETLQNDIKIRYPGDHQRQIAINEFITAFQEGCII